MGVYRGKSFASKMGGRKHPGQTEILYKKKACLARNTFISSGRGTEEMNSFLACSWLAKSLPKRPRTLVLPRLENMSATEEDAE